MDAFSSYSDLNEILTNAPGNPFIWDKFLCRLAELSACRRSYLLMSDLIHKENTHFLFKFNLPEKLQKLTINNFNEADTFNNLMVKNPCQVICSQNSATHITAAHADNDFHNPVNLQYHFGFSIPYNTHHTLTLCVNRSQPFSNEEQDQIRILLFSIIIPFQTAIKAELEHKIHSQILLHTHDHFDSYVIVNPSLNILFSDAVFSTVIGKFKCVTLKNKTIEFNESAITEQVFELMQQNEIASINHGTDMCQVTIIPVSALDNLYGWECFQDSYILAFTYNKENNPVVKRLINIHKLSKCEALCALDFMQTPSIIEIAENTCRSQDTIRNHIKHIMHKMNVHNQAALMKKLVSLTAL